MKMYKKQIILMMTGALLAGSTISAMAESSDAFQEVEVVNNDECTIRITGIDEDNWMGYTLNLFLENKSEEKEYMFSLETATVNGLEVTNMFATDIAAGKKSNDEINLYDLDGMIDPADVTDIMLDFQVYDYEDWTADPVAKEVVHVYPQGEEAVTRYEREAQPEDVTLISSEEASVTMTRIYEDEFWGYTVEVFLENNTDKTLMFSVDDVSVNGYMIDPFWASEVSPHSMRYRQIAWSDSDLEENGITDVEEIEMQMRVYDSDDWFGDDLVNETVTITPAGQEKSTE